MKKLYICEKHEDCPGASECVFAKPFNYMRCIIACLKETEFVATCSICKHSIRAGRLILGRNERSVLTCGNKDSEVYCMVFTITRPACMEFIKKENP